MKSSILKQLHQATQGHPFNETLLTTMMKEGLLDDLPDLRRYLIIAIFQYTTEGPWSARHFSWHNYYLDLNDPSNEAHSVSKLANYNDLYQVTDLSQVRADKRLSKMQEIYTDYLEIKYLLLDQASEGTLLGQDFYTYLENNPECLVDVEEFYGSSISNGRTSMRDFFQHIHKIEGYYAEEADIPRTVRYAFGDDTHGLTQYSLIFS